MTAPRGCRGCFLKLPVGFGVLLMGWGGGGAWTAFLPLPSDCISAVLPLLPVLLAASRPQPCWASRACALSSVLFWPWSSFFAVTPDWVRKKRTVLSRCRPAVMAKPVVLELLLPLLRLRVLVGYLSFSRTCSRVCPTQTFP